MKKTLLAIALSTLIFATPAWALGDEHEQHPHAAAPVAGGEWQILYDGYTAIQAAADAKEYGKIHEIVETMEPALKTINDTHKGDAGVTGTTAQISKVLHNMHEAGDAKNAAGTTSGLKKLDGGLRILKVRLAHQPATGTK